MKSKAMRVTEPVQRWRPSQLGVWRGEAGPCMRGLLVWASKPSPRARRDGDGIRARREASRRRTRGVIVELASEGSKARWMRAQPEEKYLQLLELPLGGVYLNFKL